MIIRIFLKAVKRERKTFASRFKINVSELI
jgi:hypothetical protein